MAINYVSVARVLDRHLIRLSRVYLPHGLSSSTVGRPNEALEGPSLPVLAVGGVRGPAQQGPLMEQCSLVVTVPSDTEGVTF